MTNPMVPTEFRNVYTAPVTLNNHAIVGAGSVILPGVTVGVGASIGALTLVNKSVPDFTVVTGNPPRKIGMRSRDVLERECEFRQRLASG